MWVEHSLSICCGLFSVFQCHEQCCYDHSHVCLPGTWIRVFLGGKAGHQDIHVQFYMTKGISLQYHYNIRECQIAFQSSCINFNSQQHWASITIHLHHLQSLTLLDFWIFANLVGHSIPLGRPSAPAPSIQYRASNLSTAPYLQPNAVALILGFSSCQRDKTFPSSLVALRLS